jgi:hypothetical protein
MIAEMDVQSSARAGSTGIGLSVVGKNLRAGSRFQAGRLRPQYNASGRIAVPACIDHARPAKPRAGTPGIEPDHATLEQPSPDRERRHAPAVREDLR